MLPSSYQFEAIGTAWSIDTARELTDSEKRAIQNTIAEYSQTYSRFDEHSLVSTARKSAGDYTFPHTIGDLYSLYQKLNLVSSGAINPLVGESLEGVGYDAAYSLRHTNFMPAPDFTETMQLSGNVVTLKTEALLDVGAVGKGQLIDSIAAEIAKSHEEFVVDGSGDMRVHTTLPQAIGLEHPLKSDYVIGAVSLTKQALCGSALNRRAWGDGLHHVLDARTGKPLQTDIVATWAVANSAMLADALTTGLFFVSPQKLQQVFGDFQYVIMYQDGRVAHTIDNIGELYT